ncbi:PEGA domain-containing protein [Patescibacteria group bacterium]|nr:PEGA domain-containing protein [Patescibacteria group bacterium]
MQRKHRRIIFFVFLILFLISLPLILLYTGGYRYNIKKSKLEKTGNLLVSAETKNINVDIDNKSYYGKGELRIKNILPGEYLIKITKESYFDWQKKLTINSALTTFIKNVRLFKQNLPINLVESIDKIYPSPDKNKILYSSYDKEADRYSLLMVYADNGQDKKILTSEYPIDSAVWSPDSYKFYIKTGGAFRVVDAREGEIELSFVKNEIYNLKWHGKNSLVLFAEMPGGIYKIDLFFRSTSEIYSISKRVDDFEIIGNNLYFIDQYNLKQIDLKNSEMVYVPLERNGYKIKTIVAEKIYILNEQRGKLQIFDLPLHKLSTPILLVNAKNFDIIGNSLLFYNDFELWTYDFASGSKELITRIGANIKKGYWVNGTDYIIFILENQIKIIEMDKRDQRQIIELVKFEDINDILLTKKYDLYFIGKMNKSFGLFKLEI